MNKIKLLLFVILLSFGGASLAQNVKPKFKKFTMVCYTPYSNGGKTFIRIENRREIDSLGILHATNNLFADDNEASSFKGKILDTSYRVRDKAILDLNRVFADGKNPHLPITYKQPPAGFGFTGLFFFFSYVDEAGKTHSFIYASRFDFDDNINEALGQMFAMRFGGPIQPDKVYRDPSLEALILKCHSECKNLPKVQSQGANGLEVADPGVKH